MLVLIYIRIKLKINYIFAMIIVHYVVFLHMVAFRQSIINKVAGETGLMFIRVGPSQHYYLRSTNQMELVRWVKAKSKLLYDLFNLYFIFT